MILRLMWCDGETNTLNLEPAGLQFVLKEDIESRREKYREQMQFEVKGQAC